MKNKVCIKNFNNSTTFPGKVGNVDDSLRRMGYRQLPYAKSGYKLAFNSSKEGLYGAKPLITYSPPSVVVYTGGLCECS